MKRILFLLFFFLLPVFAVLRAEDDLLLLQKQFQAVSDEWNRYISPERRELLKRSSDVNVRKLLKFRHENIDAFVTTSRKVQKELESLKLGIEPSLIRHAESLRGVLLLCESSVENKMTNALASNQERLARSFRMIRADLDYLKEIGFSCTDGNAVLSAEAGAWPELYRYRRQLRMLQTYIGLLPKFSLPETASQKKEFLQEFSSIMNTAERLGNKVAKKYPEFYEEGLTLSVMTRKLLEEAKVLPPSTKMKLSSSSLADDPKASSECPLKINSILQRFEARIRADLRSAEKSQAESPAGSKDGSVRSQPTPEPGKKPSEPPAKKEKRIPIERRSEEELNGELARLRQQVLPDANRDSLSQDELKQCLDLLSEREQKQYETIRLRQIRNGIDEREAPLEAMKELKEILTAPGAVLPAKQEKVRILKKVLPETAE